MLLDCFLLEIFELVLDEFCSMRGCVVLRDNKVLVYGYYGLSSVREVYVFDWWWEDEVYCRYRFWCVVSFLCNFEYK